MRNRFKRLWVLLLVPALLACNLTTLIGAPAGSAPTARSRTTALPGVNVTEMEGQVRQVVSAFLKSLQDDPSGEAAKAFLAPTLLAQLPAGQNPAQLVNFQGSLPAYSLSAITFSGDAAQASVDTTLQYPQPLNLRFHLIRDGSWKINQVTRLEGDVASYPPTPEGVVQAFLTSYQESPDGMSRYLTQNRLAQLPPGGAVGMLNIRGALEGLSIESASVNPNPPTAAITVKIQSGGEGVSRVFVLRQENGLWKIDNIDNP